MLQTPKWELGELRLVDFKWKPTLKAAILGPEKNETNPRKTTGPLIVVVIEGGLGSTPFEDT